ncbi:MAG: Ig-like domain-containing protein [Burkholderiaceae bacterium]
MNLISMIFRLTRQRIWLVLLAATVALAGCGGSGAGAGGASNATTKAAALSLLSSESSLTSDGRATATITAIVKNAENVAMSGQSVSFSTTDPGATIAVTSSVTDATGRAEATLSISDKSVRSIPVTAKSGTIVTQINVPVVGTTVTINGSNNIVFNAPTDFTVSVRDSGGAAISGAVIALTSAAGNTLSAASVTSDALGQARFTVTGVNAGADTLTARTLGVTSTLQATVSGTLIAYTTPAILAEVEVNTPTDVSIQMSQSGVAMAGETITFSTTRGSFVGNVNTAVTNAAGIASVQIQSISSGFGTLTATSAGGVTSTRTIEFVSRSPSKISIQPSPAVVGANLDSSGTNSSQLIAVVKDANDNPVKGVRVDFSMQADPSNGRVEPSFAITDSFGTATASFIAGPNPSGPDKVEARATVFAAPAVTQFTTLTVSELQLAVEMGTGNKFESTDNDTTYTLPWVALVTDSSGNPVSGASVAVSVAPTRFIKGDWRDLGSGSWTRVTAITCPNEDVNRNFTLDAGEDTDNDGQLDPGAPVTTYVTSADGKTGPDGFATFEVKYAKTYASFLEVALKVTITTSSGATEGDASTTFWLNVLAEDVADVTIAPPGANAPDGPFGVVGDCANPN